MVTTGRCQGVSFCSSSSSKMVIWLGEENDGTDLLSFVVDSKLSSHHRELVTATELLPEALFRFSVKLISRGEGGAGEKKKISSTTWLSEVTDQRVRVQTQGFFMLGRAHQYFHNSKCSHYPPSTSNSLSFPFHG